MSEERSIGDILWGQQKKADKPTWLHEVGRRYNELNNLSGGEGEPSQGTHDYVPDQSGGEKPAGTDLDEIVGANAGAESARFWADRQVETGNDLYAVPGALASLWTPETWVDTANVLAGARGIGAYYGRPYWRYISENAPATGRWLTRDEGAQPPYGQDFAKAKDALQIPNPPTGVMEVKVSPLEPIRGPRLVESKDNKKYGKGGGLEYYRGWRWKENDGSTPKHSSQNTKP